MSRRIEDLDPRFQPLAVELLRRAAEERIGLTVIDTRRTEAEHAANVANGVSWAKRSKHCDGLAIDVCPTEYLTFKGWNPSGPLWSKLGEIGESIGLRWGGRWRQRDLGHFEIAGNES